ncbi:MAG: carbohydrate-binding protein, partial [Flavobacteriaceae bacterium]
MPASVFPGSGNNKDGYIDMKVGPDGHLYVLAYGAGCCPSNVGTGRLIRFDYTGISTNRAPTVYASADPNNGALPLAVNFSSDGTLDLDGDPLGYEWDFDFDGTGFDVDSTAEDPSHTYGVAGTYNAQLRVSDGNGGVGVANVTVYAGNSATVFTFVSPPDGGLVGHGDDIDLEVSATDADDGAVACGDIDVVPSLGHVNHFHDLSTTDGCQKTFFLAYDGHDISGEMDLFYVLGANHTDSGGLQSFDQIRLHPKRKEAEFYDAMSGIEVVANTNPLEGGSEAVRVDDGSYLVLEGRNLLNITGVRYNVSSESGGGDIELRVGGPTGTLLSTVSVPATGSLDTWSHVSGTLTDPGGKNDLYFVFTGSGQDIFDLNYIEFVGAGVSDDNSAPGLYDVVAQDATTVHVRFSEYVGQATAEVVGNYSLDNGVTVSGAALAADGMTVVLTTSALVSGTEYTLTVDNVENLAGIPIQANTNKKFTRLDELKINAGGTGITFGGDNFIADQYSDGGSTYTNAQPIEGTTSDEIYQTERYGSVFGYDIPVPANGTYDIRLHFAELYHGVSNTNGAGARVFDVSIEGQEVLSDFDILSEVSPLTALVKEFNDVSVGD